MTSPLLQLQELGQSPWHDNIRRGQLTSGELARMVAAGDITGLTSNPTIFEKAISQSDDYDEALGALALAGDTAREIFDRLSIEDIRAAADVFAPVYKHMGGADGYVSIEVAPEHAHDADATGAEARRLWQEVDRPNLMVKIPATRAGLSAISETIAAGINVNATLIFSLKRYREVMEAYLLGLEQRLAHKERIGQLASVASFFVSRIDTLVDKLLDERIAEEPQAAGPLAALKGRAAIASAKLAYRMFQEFFHGSRWGTLAAQGARVQRPLWASTSAKNPEYSDVLYVENLIGPNSVNTMPPHTLQAFREHGRARMTVTQGVDEAAKYMRRLAEAHIDMDAVTRQLEDEGVAAFFESFENLIAVIDERRRQILDRQGNAG